MLKKAQRILQRAENFVMIAAFAVMVVAFFTQVINRNFLGYSMPWLEELAVYSMIYMVLLGTEAGLRDGSQIAVTAVVDQLSGRAKIAMQLVAKLIVVVFSAAMLLASFNIVKQQIGSGQTSAALRVPMWLPYGAFLLAFAIIVVVQTTALGVLVIALMRGEESLAASVEARQDEIESLLIAEGAMPPGPDSLPSPDIETRPGEDPR